MSKTVVSLLQGIANDLGGQFDDSNVGGAENRVFLSFDDVTSHDRALKQCRMIVANLEASGRPVADDGIDWIRQAPESADWLKLKRYAIQFYIGNSYGLTA